jgi:hypothetical protein
MTFETPLGKALRALFYATKALIASHGKVQSAAITHSQKILG